MRCLKCDYDLRNLTESRCPECGSQFNPRNPDTFKTGSGELPRLLWSAALFFFVMLSYATVKPVRDTMGLTGGVDKLPWLITTTLISMIVLNPLFSMIVSRLRPSRFVPLVFGLFMAGLIVFRVLHQLVDESARLGVGYALYVWLSVFNLFVVSVFWGLMADTWNSNQSKRLFGFIGVGGTLGAMCGPVLTTALVKGFSVGSQKISIAPVNMLLVSLAPMAIALMCARIVAAHRDGSARFQQATKKTVESDALAGARLMARSPYLSVIAVYVFIFATTSTFLYLELNKIIEQTYTDQSSRVLVFARFDFWTNALTLTVQALLTARIIRWVGLAGALALVPAITVCGFAGIALRPDLWMVGLFQVVRKATHHGVDRPARETLYTIVSTDAKFASKTLIDTFIYRSGDLIGAWLPGWLAVVGVAIGWIAIPLALAWMGMGLLAGVWNSRALSSASQRDMLLGDAARTNRESVGDADPGRIAPAHAGPTSSAQRRN
jgi:AAA family ATP:ADP antiporter